MYTKFSDRDDLLAPFITFLNRFINYYVSSGSFVHVNTVA